MNDAGPSFGLEDVTVAQTRLSSIDGEEGALLISGYPVEDIAPNATYEEELYLLLHDSLPNAEELRDFRADLARRRSIPDEVASVVRRAAREGRPAMDALRMGLAAVTLSTDLGDPSAAEAEDEALRVVAAMPTIVAAYWRFRQGADPVSPRTELGHAANYLYMLRGEEPSQSAVRGLETYLNTVVDHGLNASTFAARTVVSTEADLVSAATAAVGALKGPLHGGAPGPVLKMIQEAHDRGNCEEVVRARLDAGERLMGFGHRVYRARDPRADVLSAAAEQFYAGAGRENVFETARELEAVGSRLLAERKPDRRLETNVEFYTAVLLHGIGLPAELFSPTFAVSRAGGWVAHALEQKRNNRLVRPVARYDGAEGRTWTPIGERK